MPPTIGIVGGMGNEAMADLAGNLESVPEAEDYSYVFYGNSRQAFTPDEADDEWEQGDPPLLRKRQTGGFTAGVLQNYGAVRAGLACNDMHPLFRDLYADLDTEFVDMIAETAATAADDAGVLVLGTKRTLDERLYDTALEAAGLETFQPTPAHRADLMEAIYNPDFGIKTGTLTERAEALLCELIQEECDRHPSIGTVVLGCTELPLALNDASIGRLTDAGRLPEGLSFIDPTMALAEALVAGDVDDTRPPTISLDRYRGDYLDFHPPFACRVDSLATMQTLQSRLIEWTVDYFEQQDASVGGSYMHLPTLFFVNYDEPIPPRDDAEAVLDVPIYEYTTAPEEPDSQVRDALARNFEAVSHLV